MVLLFVLMKKKHSIIYNNAVAVVEIIDSHWESSTIYTEIVVFTDGVKKKKKVIFLKNVRALQYNMKNFTKYIITDVNIIAQFT